MIRTLLTRARTAALAALEHLAPSVPPHVEPPTFTDAELDLLRGVPLNQWQAVIDAHREIAAVETVPDVLARMGGGR